MKKRIVLFLLLLIQYTAWAQTKSEQLDEYLTAAQKSGLFNGTVLIAKGNQVLLEKGYGYKNVAAKTNNNENTIFQVGSVTKQFTATVIMKLAEQKKLSLQDRMSKYFPDYKIAANVTIENLLTHTSGIYNYTNDAVFMSQGVTFPATEKQMLAMFTEKPLAFAPGTKFSYSNSGYCLLGYIIEKVTGKKYEQVVREEILQPFAMSHSGFDFTNLSSPDKATGHSYINGESALPSVIVDSSVSFAAGALYTTVGDLYAWNKAVMRGAILKPSSLKNAFTPRLEGYGFGWFIDTVYGKQRIAHGGGIHGFNSSNTVIPADSLSITLISNANSSTLNDVSKTVLDILFNKPYTIPSSTTIQVDTTILRQYVGEYQLAPTFSIVVTLVGNQLRGQATGQPAFELYAKSDSTFFLKVVKAEVDFLRNEQGEVDKMILHQNGADMPGKKIK